MILDKTEMIKGISQTSSICGEYVTSDGKEGCSEVFKRISHRNNERKIMALMRDALQILGKNFLQHERDNRKRLLRYVKLYH